MKPIQSYQAAVNLLKRYPAPYSSHKAKTSVNGCLGWRETIKSNDVPILSIFVSDNRSTTQIMDLTKEGR